MNENDDEKYTQSAGGSGLGHDPLEWLQDDDEVTAVEAESTSSAPASTDVAAGSTSAAIPVVEANIESEPESAEVTQESTSASENQSYTFDNHKAILTLPEKLTVQIIEPLHSEWKALLYDLPQSLEVDASKVKDIDAAGMQLFYVLVKEMIVKGSDVAIINVEASLQRHFKLFGLDEFFGQYMHAA